MLKLACRSARRHSCGQVVDEGEAAGVLAYVLEGAEAEHALPSRDWRARWGLSDDAMDFRPPPPPHMLQLWQAAVRGQCDEWELAGATAPSHPIAS